MILKLRGVGCVCVCVWLDGYVVMNFFISQEDTASEFLI